MVTDGTWYLFPPAFTSSPVPLQPVLLSLCISVVADRQNVVKLNGSEQSRVFEVLWSQNICDRRSSQMAALDMWQITGCGFADVQVLLCLSCIDCIAAAASGNL